MRTFIFVWLSFLLFQTQSSAQCPPSTQAGTHVVQKGETMYAVSRKYKVPVADLCRWNNRTLNDVLSECTVLWVRIPTQNERLPDYYQPAYERPAPAPQEWNAPQPTPQASLQKAGTRQTGGTHLVAEGETIANIARLYGYTEERFREFNGLDPYYVARTNDLLRSTDCTCPQNWSGQHVEVVTEPPRVPGRDDKPRWRDDNTYQPAEYQQPVRNEYRDDRYDYYDRPVQKDNKTTANEKTKTKPTTPTNTAKSKVSFMTSEEMDMVSEINLIRSNPPGYVKYVEDYIEYLRKNGELGASISTCRELIDELRRTPRLSTLEPSECVTRAARKHGDDQRPTGDTNHQGRDGSWPWDRILRECKGFTDGNENLVGGPSDVRRAVMLLLVDEGIDSRGHRKTLLNPDWKYVGCYKIGTVGSMPNCWVQNFAY